MEIDQQPACMREEAEKKRIYLEWPNAHYVLRTIVGSKAAIRA